MESSDTARRVDAAKAESGADALIADLESALDAEYEALLARNPDALLAACSSKVAAVEAIAALRRPGPDVIVAWRPRLRAAAIASVRNQTLLSVLRARIDDRVRILGLAGATYDRGGQRRISVTARPLSVG